MKTSLFNYHLPEGLIAQKPAPRRELSNLMILDRQTGKIKMTKFAEIAKFFRGGDVLVLNDTKVIPARIMARRKTGAKIEILLLKKKKDALWECLIKPLRKVKENETLEIDSETECQLVEKKNGKGTLKFNHNIEKKLEKIGEIPLPPYIKKKKQDTRRYQTVFARKSGAIAAPTAGLHFTKKILKEIEKKGTNICFVTLHVGFATFNPIKSENIEDHVMEEEFFEIYPESAEIINKAIRKGNRIIACGTTVTRALESGYEERDGRWFVVPGCGMTKLFITPKYKFKIINGLITNFHLPRTSLLVLVSTFAGKEFIAKAYKKAIENHWRFFSFGDCMLIL